MKIYFRLSSMPSREILVTSIPWIRNGGTYRRDHKVGTYMDIDKHAHTEVYDYLYSKLGVDKNIPVEIEL